jgi:hypothetical protein
VLTDSGSIDETVLSAGQQTSTSVLTETVTPDKQKQALYDSLRVGVVDQGGNAYRVNNPFLNVRQSMNVSSPLVAKLDQGALVTVLDIPTAEWAQVKMTDGKEGYVAFRYLAKPTTDARLPAEKKQFEGKFFVDFAFLNVRKDPTAQSEKVGELPGQASAAQNEIFEWVVSLGVKAYNSDTGTIPGWELDVSVPDAKFAIDFNGLYWHSELVQKNKSQHNVKSRIALKHGIRLFHVFEDEWRDKRDIVKSMVMHRLSMSPTRIFARKCSITI